MNSEAALALMAHALEDRTASGGPILATPEVRVYLWTEPLLVADPDRDPRPGTIILEVERLDPSLGWFLSARFQAPLWDRDAVAEAIHEALGSAR